MTIRGYLILLTVYRILLLFLIAQPVLLISAKTREPRITALIAAGTLGMTSLLYLIRSSVLQSVNFAYLLEGRVLVHHISSGSISGMLLLCGWMLTFVPTFTNWP